jgi:hypothetical protein
MFAKAAGAAGHACPEAIDSVEVLIAKPKAATSLHVAALLRASERIRCFFPMIFSCILVASSLS